MIPVEPYQPLRVCEVCKGPVEFSVGTMLACPAHVNAVVRLWHEESTKWDAREASWPMAK